MYECIPSSLDETKMGSLSCYPFCFWRLDQYVDDVKEEKRAFSSWLEVGKMWHL